ncbi:MAG: tRNA uridine-5-carboxymethylaminomethyl(34) synthesis GTPase MnmE [Acetivibrionales bacterium]|jgi:tRNA modification GTPase|nr:tRNA uridine-5-carboxymethylaminomethyl(34) synthesis GTPase MnmE [Clostridiaceae bacterium]
MINDTIAGISTAVGNSGISVIRMSGPEAVLIADRLFKGKKRVSEQESHTVQYGKILFPETGESIDEVLLTKMKAPRTYTREDVVEISSHGGYTIARALLNLLYENGARPAEAGEFTKRAFLNGRIDLSQAEAVMDIIQARTERVSKVAIKQLEGDVSQRLNQIRESIILLLSGIEVNLDYPEYDAEEVTINQIEQETEKIIKELDNLIKSFRFGKLLREGMEVVIAGKPNVGKSSLMNRLTRKNKSIVTDIPGTTRDVIEDYINIKGIPVKLLDTAGVRSTHDIVEQQGVERSLKAISDADLIIVIFDSSREIGGEDQSIINKAKEEQKPYILCFNKIDLIEDEEKLEALKMENPHAKFISITEDAGIEKIEESIFNFATENNQDIDNQVLITNARHEHQLKRAKEYLETVLSNCKMRMTLDILALDLKASLEELGKITGHHADEDVVNAIFARFCLGK